MLYNRDISKEELAEHILRGWMRNREFPNDVQKFIEDNLVDIPWIELHIVVKKDLSRVGISNIENAEIGKGFSGFQKVSGVTVLILFSGKNKIGIYHDGIRLRAIQIIGSNAEENKKDIVKKIKPSFKVVEEVKVVSTTKKKKTKKQIKEVIEEAVEEAVDEIVEDKKDEE